jgi:hypothetical protein
MPYVFLATLTPPLLPSSSPQNIVIIHFTGRWCWCSKRSIIDPIFESMVTEFPSVDFVKVDVDTNFTLAYRYLVLSSPTFVVFIRGRPVRHAVFVDAQSLKVGCCYRTSLPRPGTDCIMSTTMQPLDCCTRHTSRAFPLKPAPYATMNIYMYTGSLTQDTGHHSLSC